jgi:hypothetical protein
MKYWLTFGYVQIFILAAIPHLKNIRLLIPYSLTTSHQENLHWELGLANKLDIFCCWIFFRLIIALPLIVKHGLDRFYREKLTCCGFWCTYFGCEVDSHLFQIIFDSVVMDLDLSSQFTIRFCVVNRSLLLQGSQELWTINNFFNFTIKSELPIF